MLHDSELRLDLDSAGGHIACWAGYSLVMQLMVRVGLQGDLPAAAATGPAIALDVCCAVSCLSITRGMTA